MWLTTDLMTGPALRGVCVRRDEGGQQPANAGRLVIGARVLNTPTSRLHRLLQPARMTYSECRLSGLQAMQWNQKHGRGR